jgi:hypothetical protein
MELINIPFENSDLQICLFFEQSDEVGRKQRKNPDTRRSSTELSPETVDAFPLVPAALALQGIQNQRT